MSGKKEITVQEYQEWAETVQEKLKCQQDWIDKYEGYAKGLLEYKVFIEKHRKTFHVPYPLTCYVTIGEMYKKHLVFDLRFLGQSVGQIKFKGEVPYLYVDVKKSEDSKCFGYKLGSIVDQKWDGDKAKEFRKFFREISKESDLFPKIKEHMVESRLYQELAKTKGSEKQLKGIQPITYANCFFPITTAVTASLSKDKIVNVAKKTGGGIDILCRRRESKNQSRITVIEVKDKPEAKESFNEAMFQAISYAVFVRELIRSKCGEKWMKIWGLEKQYERYGQSGFVINAVVAIPIKRNDKLPDFHGEELQLGNDKIELHYMALKTDNIKPNEDFELVTSL